MTGFLGPNGAGKSTTLRMLLGLEAHSVHPGRTVFHHLMLAGNRVKGFSLGMGQRLGNAPHCSPTRPSSSSANRSTASTLRGCYGSAICSDLLPHKAARSSSPRT